MRVDERLHEAAALSDRPRPQHRTHWQLRNAHRDAAAVRLRFAQADSREWRVGEHAERDEPVAGGAICSGQVIANDTEIIEGHMRELWAPGAVAERPHLGCARLQAIVDGDVAVRVQFDAGLVQADRRGVRCAPRRNEDIAALDGPVTLSRADGDADAFSRAPLTRRVSAATSTSIPSSL